MLPGPSVSCQSPSCPELALSFYPFCWEHANREDFYSALRQNLKTLTGKNSFTLNLKKAHLTDFDFSGLKLQGSVFSLSHISNSSLIGANLSETNFTGARINSCDFVGSDIYRANFTKAVIASSSFSHTDLRGSYLVEAHFKDTDFMGAVLFDCVLWNADLTGAQNIKQSNFRNPDSKKIRPSFHLSEDNAMGAYESYRNIKHYFYHKGLYEAASWAAYRELTMERKHYFEKKDPRFVPSFLMNLLSGYTEKPARVVLSSLFIVIVFGILYFALNVPVENLKGVTVAPKAAGFWECVYFSFITFTTVGYGDFTPRAVAWFRLLACTEAFSGPFMAGLYVFTLTRRYAAS